MLGDLLGKQDEAEKIATYLEKVYDRTINCTMGGKTCYRDFQNELNDDTIPQNVDEIYIFIFQNVDARHILAFQNVDLIFLG